MKRSEHHIKIVSLSISLAAALLSVFGVAPLVTAHIGGKSAVKVNNQPVSSNAFSAYYVSIPSDISLDTFTTKDKVAFEIDETVFPYGSHDYQWHWESDNDKNFSTGAKASHTFSKVGMHVVYLKYRGLQNNYHDVIDTIGVAIVPHSDYNMPAVKVRVSQADPANDPYNLKFQATAAVDKTAKLSKFLWQFNDASTAEGSTVTHKFTDIREINNAIIAVTTLDSNSLKTNATVHPIMNSSGTIDSSIVQDNYRAVQTKNLSPWLISGIILAITAGLFVIILLVRRYRRKKRATVKISEK